MVTMVTSIQQKALKLFSIKLTYSPIQLRDFQLTSFFDDFRHYSEKDVGKSDCNYIRKGEY